MSVWNLEETNPILQIYKARAIIVEKDQEIERLRQENERLENFNKNQLELTQKVAKLEEDLASRNVISEFSLNDFTEKQLIGRGGEAEVFCGYNGRLGKVAFKRIIREVNETYKSEVILLVKHSNHPNIIRLFGLLTPEEGYLPNSRSCIGYIMERMERSLFDVIHNISVEYNMEQVYAWIEKASSGLQYLHEEGIMHRDIKPQNILLGKSLDDLRISDFGLAKAVEPQTIASHTYGLGTIDYMAPELLNETKYGKSADIYALTITFWEIIHRKRPYDYGMGVRERLNQMNQILNGERPNIQEELEISVLLIRGWDSNPKNRPKMSEFIEFSRKKRPAQENLRKVVSQQNANQNENKVEKLSGEQQNTSSLQPPAADPIVNVSNQRQPGIRANEPVGLVSVTRRLTTMNVDSPFFDHLPREITIVLFSETGTGKSTFINSIVNYLLYETLNEAINEGVQILIRTCFSHTSDYIEQVRIDLPPNLFTDSTTGNNKENENTEPGQTSTQTAHSYVFKFGPAGNEKKITIIDTPGIGDEEKDMKNFHNTLASLSKYRSINAFCILLKPNLSTLTVSFRFCINELLSALHVSARNNILFCLTNTRATSYRTGETIPILKVEMKKLKEKRGITIPISRETVFCFENECYRLLCELTYGIKYSKETIDSFSPSWNHSMAETYRMFEQIIKLKPHNMKETLSINDIRAVILSFSRPLGEIARNQEYNEKLIEDKLKLITRLKKEGKALKDQLYVDQIVLETEKTKYPVTVCAAQKCVKRKTIDGVPGGLTITMFKTECNKECYLKNVEQKLVENSVLQKCWALHNNPEKCRICGCSWKFHLFVDYRFILKIKKVVNKRVEESINKNEAESRSAEIFINELQQKKDKNRKEMNMISKASVEFVAFLKQNSITGYNDAYLEYLDLLIQQESYKISRGGNNQVMEKLKQIKSDYKKQIELLDTHGAKSSCTKSSAELYEMIENLRNLEFYGQILKDVELLEMKSTNYKDDAT